MKQTPNVLIYVDAIIKKCSSEMPRTCSNCQKTYNSFREFIKGTEPIGIPQAYFKAGQDPMGMLSYVNCPCGGTMVLKCEDLQMQEQFRATIDAQATLEGRPQADILAELRAEVRRKVCEA